MTRQGTNKHFVRPTRKEIAEREQVALEIRERERLDPTKPEYWKNTFAGPYTIDITLRGPKDGPAVAYGSGTINMLTVKKTTVEFPETAWEDALEEYEPALRVESVAVLGWELHPYMNTRIRTDMRPNGYHKDIWNPVRLSLKKAGEVEYETQSERSKQL
jgi:hypothetical protein